MIPKYPASNFKNYKVTPPIQIQYKFNKWHGFETETCNIAVNKTKIGSNCDSKEGKQKHNGKISPSST